MKKVSPLGAEQSGYHVKQAHTRLVAERHVHHACRVEAQAVGGQAAAHGAQLQAVLLRVCHQRLQLRQTLRLVVVLSAHLMRVAPEGQRSRVSDSREAGQAAGSPHQLLSVVSPPT